MKIKKGDTVIVVSGASKGKKGTVLRVIPLEDRVLVEGVNVKKKHERKHTRDGQGQVIEVARPIHLSNVMLLDPKGGKPTRVGKEMIKDKKIRVAVKSRQEIK